MDGNIQEMIMYESNQSANRASIETNINTNYNIFWDGSQTGLLDDYPNASAAYSLRALNSAYTGPAIEVRKTVGSVTSIQDIGFLYDGSLDTTSLLSFAGSDDVFVAKWYDQSGEGNNAIMSSAARQASIVLSGVLNTLNGKPSVLGVASTFYQTASNPNFNGANGNCSGFVVSQLTADFGGVMTLEFATITFRYFNISNTSFRIQTADTSGTNTFLVTSPATANSVVVSSFFRSTTSISTSANGNTNSTTGLNAGRSTSNDKLTIMGLAGSNLGLESYFSEAILYPSDESSSGTEIETNINDYYTIY